MVEEEQREAANAEVRLWEEQHRSIVECWRDMIYFTPPQVYASACETRPFEFDESPPAKPNQEKERNKLAAEIRRAHLKKRPIPIHFQLCIPAIAFVVALVTLIIFQSALGGVSWVLATLAFAGSCAGGYWGLRKWWTAEFENQVQEEADQAWPTRRARLEQVYAEVVSEYEGRKRAAAKKWHESERERTAWARRLASGD